MNNISKVLFIRLGGIGDVVFTLPAIHMARENLPHAQFTFLTSRGYAPIIKGFPGIDQILTIDKEIYHRKNLPEIWGFSRSLLKVLKKQKYQLVIDFQSFGETALISWLSGAKNRWGITHHKFRDRIYTVQFNEILNSDKPHQVDINRQLLATGGFKSSPIKNQFNLPEEELQKARDFLLEHSYNPDKPSIFIQPFSNYAEKNWPLDNYYTIAQHFKNLGIQVIFGGGPSDKDALGQMANEFPVSAGKVGLLTTAGLMKLSKIVVGGDTGLLHLAVAMDKRVLMLMASTKPNEYGPYGHPEWTISPANNQKIDKLPIEVVQGEIQRIINHI